MHLFTYGSLMIPELMQALTGDRFRTRSALLPDYARYQMRNQAYPAIVPEIGSDTAGIVYLDLDPYALARIDSFEGTEYRRAPVKLLIEGGQWLEACTYVLRPGCRDRLGPQCWSLSCFREHHLEQFMRECKRFISL